MESRLKSFVTEALIDADESLTTQVASVCKEEGLDMPGDLVNLSPTCLRWLLDRLRGELCLTLIQINSIEFAVSRQRSSSRPAGRAVGMGDGKVVVNTAWAHPSMCLPNAVVEDEADAELLIDMARTGVASQDLSRPPRHTGISESSMPKPVSLLTATSDALSQETSDDRRQTFSKVFPCPQDIAVRGSERTSLPTGRISAAQQVLEAGLRGELMQDMLSASCMPARLSRALLDQSTMQAYGHLDMCSSDDNDLPANIPAWAVWLLLAFGILSPKLNVCPQRPRLYLWHHRIVTAIPALSSTYYLMSMIANLLLGFSPGLDIIWIVFSVLFHNVLRQWRRSFSLGKPAWLMLIRAARTEFKWTGIRRRARVMIVVTTVINFLYVASVIFEHSIVGSRWQVLSVEDHLVLAKAGFWIELGSLCFRLGLHSMIILAVPWLTIVSCALHRHDLLTYAHSVSASFEVDDGSFNPIKLLTEFELLVTRRLRHASCTWVRGMVFIIMAVAVNFFSSAFLLLSGVQFNRDRMVLLTMVGSLYTVVLMGYELASVSETYEYDVLRVLNNPTNLNKARVHIGDQLIPHVQCLDWGFRFAGSVISSRYVSALMAAMMGTMATTLGDYALKIQGA